MKRLGFKPRMWKSEEVVDDESGKLAEKDDMKGVGRSELDRDRLKWSCRCGRVIP